MYCSISTNYIWVFRTLTYKALALKHEENPVILLVSRLLIEHLSRLRVFLTKYFWNTFSTANTGAQTHLKATLKSTGKFYIRTSGWNIYKGYSIQAFRDIRAIWLRHLLLCCSPGLIWWICLVRWESPSSLTTHCMSLL